MYYRTKIKFDHFKVVRDLCMKNSTKFCEIKPECIALKILLSVSIKSNLTNSLFMREKRKRERESHE